MKKNINWTKLRNLNKEINKPLRKNRLFGKILFIGCIAILIILFYSSLKILGQSLGIIGFNIINWPLIIYLFISFGVFVIYYKMGKFLLKEEYLSLRKKLNFWTILSIFLVFLTLIIGSGILVNIYPGVKEMNTAYGWTIQPSNEIQEIRQYISPVSLRSISNPKSTNFIEGENVKTHFNISHPNYNISKLIFSQADINGKTINDKEFCKNVKECEFRFTINKTTKRYYLNLYISNGTKEEYVAFRVLKPRIMDEEEYEKKMWNALIVISTLFSVILVSIFTGVNQLRQIVQNK